MILLARLISTLALTRVEKTAITKCAFYNKPYDGRDLTPSVCICAKGLKLLAPKLKRLCE